MNSVMVSLESRLVPRLFWIPWRVVNALRAADDFLDDVLVIQTPKTRPNLVLYTTSHAPEESKNGYLAVPCWMPLSHNIDGS